MVTTREMAIARSVIYASLFDYPLTLEQLHHSLIESDADAAGDPRRLRRQRAAARHHRISRRLLLPGGARRSGGRAAPARGAQRRVSRRGIALALRLICALPFTRLVALSGSIAHRNLEPNGDLDLFIVTRGPRVWTVTVMLLVLTKLLRRRRTICANFVLADSHLAVDQQDLFTANQVIHLRPLIGAECHRAVPRGQPVRRALLSQQRDADRATAADRTCAAAGCALVKRVLEVDPRLPVAADRDRLPARLRVAPAAARRLVAITRSGAAAVGLPEAPHAQPPPRGAGPL